MATTVFRPGDRPLLHLGLFLATIGTTFLAFLLMFTGERQSFWEQVSDRFNLGESLTFSLCLVTILGSHEMGHYVLARRHRVDSSLPYFIPTPPFLTFGTLGAVIRLRGRIPNRNALVDIGAAGPLMGILVALPVLIYGVATMKLVELPAQAPGIPGPMSGIAVARHLLEWIHGLYLHAPPLPEPTLQVTFFGDSLLTRGLKALIIGPLPQGQDVQENAAFLAGWVGLVVTTLNLIPIGQLDGGHVTHALLGPRAIQLGKIAAAGLVVLAVLWSLSWLLWFIVATRVVGFGHPPVVDAEQPLTRGRKLICAACLVVLAVTLMPAPISVVSG